MAREHLFTSEDVSEGHPDKLAGQVSDAFLAPGPDRSEAQAGFSRQPARISLWLGHAINETEEN